MNYLNLDTLINLALERETGLVEIQLAGKNLTVYSADMLPERNRLLLAQAQSGLSDYYTTVLQEQGELEEKLKDKTLSATQRMALQAESKQTNIDITLKMFAANESLLQDNLTYIEAICQLNKGQFMEMIEDGIDGRIAGDRKDQMIALVVAQTSQLIRTALDEMSKKMQEAIEETVKARPNPPITIPMLPEEANGKKSKAVSAVA